MESFRQLQDPLISDEGLKYYKQGILQDYLEKKNQKQSLKRPEQDNPDHGYQPAKFQDKNQEGPCTDQIPMMNFLDETRDYVDPNLGAGGEQQDFKEFYPRSTAVHHIPSTKLLSFCVQKNNPKVFATIVQTSTLFDKKFDLKELINFQDYKRLECIRVKNYVNLLKIITQIEATMFPVVKEKLFQIKRLTEYLGLGLGSLYDKVIAHKDLTEFNLEDEDDGNFDDDLIREEDDNYGGDDEELIRYYEQSYSNNTWDRNFHYILSREEEKWALRAQFLESYYERILSNHTYFGWKDYFEAKLDELDSLDLQFSKIEPDPSNSVFYLHEFLENYFKRQEALKNNGGNSTATPTTKDLYSYTREEQELIERPNLFPKLVVQNRIDNRYNLVKSIMCLREKLCLKIKRREADSDYIITVFEKKSFGNEKIFEKRMNLRNHQNLQINKFELDPTGNFLYLRIDLNGTLDLIFNVMAANKVPLVIKNRSEYIGFNDQFFYAARRGNKTYEILVPDEEEIKRLDDLEKARIAKEADDLQKKINAMTKAERRQYYKDNPPQSSKKKQPPANTKKNTKRSGSSGKVSKPAQGLDSAEITKEEQKLSREETKKRDEEEKKRQQQEEEEKKKKEEEERLKKKVIPMKKEYIVKEIYRLFQYDLHEFENIKTFDLDMPHYAELKQDNFTNKDFGLYNHGYYYLRKILEQDKLVKYELYLNNKLCKIDALDKIEDKMRVQVKVNKKGTAVLVSIRKEDAFNVYLYEKEKLKNKKDLEIKFTKKDYLPIKEYIVKQEEQKIEWDHRIETLETEFIILIKDTKADRLSIFKNDTIMGTCMEKEYERMIINHEIDTFNSFYIPDSNTADQIAKNEIRYRIWEPPTGEKKEFTKISIQFEMFNQSTTVCFPYLFFIYNHDQVYMKDLTQPDKHGYYYMNGFMGIEQGRMRPLTVSCYTYNNKICLNIPVVLTGYEQNEFTLRVHQIKTFQSSSHAFKFVGTVRYVVMGYNQELFQTFLLWSKFVQDSSTRKLYDDIKIFFRRNCMHIERWEKGKCMQRLLVTLFNEPLSQDRNLGGNIDQLQHKQRSFWLIIAQSGEQIQFFKREARCSFQVSEISKLEMFWEHADDDQNNQVYQILVDTLVKNRIEVYFLYQNATMRKFSTIIPAYNSTAAFAFEENPHQFSLESSFQVKNNQNDSGNSDKKDSGPSGKINLFDNQITVDYFIANGILYSSNAIIDLKAELINGKNQVGIDLNNGTYLKNQKEIVKMNYSYNEAKLAAFYKVGTDFAMVIGPLINSRMLPQFYHRRFRHPVVPIIDKKRGFTAVFTMTLQPVWTSQQNAYDKMKQLTYRDNYNVQPGILIKYFNGIEQKIPMKHQFIEITRLVISKDGKNIVIIGTKYEQDPKEQAPKEQAQPDQKLQPSEKITQGIFIYEFKMNENTDKSPELTMIKQVIFPNKLKALNENDYDKKLDSIPYYKMERLFDYQKEIQTLEVGEYEGDSFLNYVSGIRDYYQYDINLEQTDEDFLKEKLNMEYEQQKKKVQERRQQFVEAQKVLQQETPSPVKKQSVKTPQAPVSETLGDSLKKKMAQDEDQKIKEEEDKIEADYKAKLKDIYIFKERLQTNKDYPSFDLPYYQSKHDYISYYFSYLYKNQSITITRQNFDDEYQLDYEYQKLYQTPFNGDERSRILRVLDSLHVFLNENKDMFIINRYNNKLYAFLYNDNERNYDLKTFKFARDFQIDTVDSSIAQDDKGRDPNKLIAVWSKNRILVISTNKLSELRINDWDHNPLLEKIGNSVSTTNHHSIIIYDSNNKNYTKKDANNIFKEYTFSVLDVKIYKNKLIQKLKDKEGVEFLKIINVDTGTTIFYLENSSFLISGNKEYIWLLQENQVYDLERGLSTFFLWTGDQISTHGYDSMDVFNIYQDNSIMVTQGYLQLAFNMISQKIDTMIENNNEEYEKVPWFNIPNWFMYQCYKMANYKSVLERIFSADQDKHSEDFYKKQQNEVPQQEEKKADDEKDKEPSDNKEKVQMKSLQTLLGHFTNVFNPEAININYITMFFLSYYYIKRPDNHVARHFDLRGVDKHQMHFKPGHWNIFQKMFSIKDKRYELIEDILHYISSCNSVPILQNCINSCFLYFLENASNSFAFQDYLNNVMNKTKQMTETEKFQFKTTADVKYMVAAHDSPILDEKFYNDNQKSTETKKDVEIAYIAVGDLLNEQGSKIMEKLSEKQNLKLMDIPFIRYLVMYQWLLIKDEIMNRLLKPFIVLLVLFSIYSIYFITYTDVVIETEEEPLAVTVVQTMIATAVYYANLGSLFIVLMYFFYQEGKQLIGSPKDYFQSFWNMVDILNYSLCLMVLFLETFSLSRNVLRPTATLCFIVLWIKAFYFLRVFDSTAQLIRMIIEIVNDMKNFVVVLMIGLFAFAGGLQILQYGLYTAESPTLFVGADFFKAFIYTYRLALGDFQLDQFDAFEESGLIVEYYLIWIIFIFGTLFLVIVLLNLLIAIMGDTFSKVLESIQNLIVREKVMLISENEPLFQRSNLFKNSQFLVIINEKQMEGGQAENWDGQINALKRQIMDKVSRLETSLVFNISEIQREIRKKFSDQDEKYKKQTAQTDLKLKSQNEVTLGKIQDIILAIGAMDQKFVKVDSAISGLQTDVKATNLISGQLQTLSKDMGMFARAFYNKNNIDLNKLRADEEQQD